MYCKNCGQQIDDNAYVCIHCGVRTDMPLKPKGEETKKRFCAHCGNQIDANAYICVHCGVKTGVNGPVQRKNSGAATLCAILSIIVSIFSVTFLGAVLGIAGMSIAIDKSDSKAEKLNLVAILLCVFVSLCAILRGVL